MGATQTKDTESEACVIATVVAFHELDPDKIIFLSIHFRYGFLPSGGKKCRNPQPLDILPDHGDLFIDDKLGHFIFCKIYTMQQENPPPSYKCIPNASGQNAINAINQEGEHQLKSNPQKQYPLHSPNPTPVGVLEDHPLEINLHQEHPIQDTNVSLDGDKVHQPVLLPTSFKTQDGVTQHGGIQNSGNTSP